MRRALQTFVLALSGATCNGCVASAPRPAASRQTERSSVLSIDLARTRPIGEGSTFRPGASGNPAVALGRPVAALRCRTSSAGRYGVHIELFASNHEVQLPAGIGIAGGLRRGAFVVGGRCRYQLSTADPTGVIEVRPDGSRTVPTAGQLFALWGQPLSRSRLASFAGAVSAYVGGRRWTEDPRAIPLRRHDQVVLEVGPSVTPHAFYLFPPGL